MQQKITRIFL